MAIKISGTTVIDDARQLTNIASLDATSSSSILGAIGTLTANSVLLGNGTSAIQTVAPGASGNVLTSTGTTWTSATPSGVTTGKAIAMAMVFG